MTRPDPGLPGLDEGLLDLPVFDPAHRELARRASAWGRDNAALWSDRRDCAAEGTTRSVLAALGADGWFEHLAGTGADPGAPGDLRSVCLVRQSLAYADDLADFAYSIQSLSADPIRRHGSAEQRERYLPGMAAGTAIGAFAVSEKAAGSDVAALGLHADRVPDGYLLNGGKAWIANGDIADVVCVVARTGEGAGALGLTAFLVPASTPGLSVAGKVDLIAPRPIADLSFVDCLVPRDAVLGRLGGGFAVSMDLLDRFRMTVGAAAVGFARRAADAALHRAAERPIRRGTLFDLDTVKATFADIEVRLDAAFLLVARAAWDADRGNPRFARHSSIAKLFATEAAQQIVDASVQLFGAAGLVRDSVPERLYRQIRSLRVYEGSSEVQRTIIASALRPRR